MVIKGYRVGPLLKKTFHEIGQDQITTLAASAAYTFFFSLFPLLLFLAPLVSLVGDKQHIIGWLMAQLTSVLPPQQVAAIQPVLTKVVFANDAPKLMSAGLILAAWSGSNIFGTLMGTLNTAYEVRETRSWIKQQVIRLVTFVLGAVILILSTIIFLDGAAVVGWIGKVLHLGAATVLLWQIAQYPIAALGLVALAFITLYLLPNVRQHKGQVFVVSIITTVLWVAATLLFRLYMQISPPSQAYGLVGAVIVLLTWMYYTMLIILVTGELASELHHGSGAVAPDRGAIYLGRIVTGAGPGSASVERSV